MRRVVIAGDRRIAPTTRRAMPLPHEVRKSRVPFFLLIDEFSAFSTDAFAALLSEARNFATLFTLAGAVLSSDERDRDIMCSCHGRWQTAQHH